MIYEEVFKEFEKRKVKYLIVGGIAVNFYGYVRLTVDLDLMIDLSDENLSKIVDILEKLGYVPKVPVEHHELISKEKRDEWIQKKGAIVFTFIHPENPFKLIDIFLVNPVNFEQAYSNKKVIQIKGINVNVASIDDLIKMKSLCGRPRDIEDINHLKRIKQLREKCED